MFNLFKKKVRKIQNWEYDLLKKVAEKLPEKYSFLKQQMNENFLRDSLPNEILGNGWKRTILDLNSYKSIKDKDLNFQLKGVKVYDRSSQKFLELQLDIYEGILIGYKFPDGDYDLNQIDASKLEEGDFIGKDEVSTKKYQDLFKGKHSNILDLKGGFEIEISNQKYYVIKDFEDGNYLSIDEKGIVYGMFHDPYLIEQISDNIVQFIDDVNTNKFSVDDYYSAKFK